MREPSSTNVVRSCLLHRTPMIAVATMAPARTDRNGRLAMTTRIAATINATASDRKAANGLTAASSQAVSDDHGRKQRMDARAGARSWRLGPQSRGVESSSVLGVRRNR